MVEPVDPGHVLRRTTRPRLYATTLPLIVAAVVFVAAVIADVAPASPAQRLAIRTLGRIVHPYFEQVWTLFAPNPPVLDSDLFLQIQYIAPNRQEVQTSGLISITAPATRALHARSWLPPKLPSVQFNLTNLIPDHSHALGNLPQTSSSSRSESRAVHRLRTEYASELSTLRRMLSAYAIAATPRGTRIVRVRGTIFRREVQPYSHRHDGNYRPQTKQVFDSGWLPFSADVRADG